MFNLRRIALFFCLLPVLLGAFYPVEIFLACVKFQAQRYFKKSFDATLVVGPLLWEEGHIVCKNGKILHADLLEATFVEAKFKPSWKWKKKEIGGDLEIGGVQITHFPTQFPPLRERRRSLRSFFSLNLKTTIREGEIILNNRPLYFSAEHQFRGGVTTHLSFSTKEGEFHLDWDSPDILMRVDFQGDLKEIFSLLPPSFQTFADDYFVLKATMSRSKEGSELEGTLLIAKEEEHQLTFGCLFRGEKRLGWFRGDHFPLEKFLAPFLLTDARMELTGRADFEGTFDERYLVITYEGRDIELQSPHFSLKAETREDEKGVKAAHYFDLQKGGHVGFLPLQNGSYHQKNRDLLFTQAHALVHFENAKIDLQEVEAFWNNLSIKGEIGIEIKSLDDIDLKIASHSLKGPACDAQQLLSHFSDSIFWEIPFVGDVASEGDVFSFHYHFSPTAELIAGYLRGGFKGWIENPHLECSGHVTYNLKEIGIDFVSPLASFHSSITSSIALTGEGISLQANRLESGLEITHFVYGEWEGEGEVEWSGQEIEIKRLLLSDPAREGLCALSGVYQRDQKQLRGRIETFRWGFGETLSLWKPKGEVFGSGSFMWNLAEGAQAFLAASFKDLEFGGIHFGSGKDLTCTYTSKFGLSVEGLEAEIGVERYKLGRFSYDFKQSKIHFEGFDFSLPPERLPRIAELASALFPGKIHSACSDWVEAIQEPLEGRFSLEVYPDNIWVSLSLKDGLYHFSNKELNLKNFKLIYDPIELSIWTQVLHHGCSYWVRLNADSMTMSHGKLEISERENATDSLIAKWERQGERGWCVRSIKGNFQGIQVALESPSKAMNFSERIELVGQVGIDMGQSRSLFGGLIDRFFLGGGYALEGTFSIPKADFSSLSFAGVCTAQTFHFAGIELDSLSSEIHYDPGHITLSKFAIKDWAGSLSIGTASFTKGEKSWSLHCDALQLEDLRLSRLKSPWTQKGSKTKSFFRSFFIPSFHLNDFQADLGDINTFGGGGTLEFSNIPKRTFLTNLLLIPTEITARIGLDLTSFIPVRGIVDYEIREGKIHLNAFREMYSDGKHSRFYLAEGTNAYIDFGGNLNMKLKMKQYNLLMKLAEFFTITVKGTLLHPTYTFSNQIEEE